METGIVKKLSNVASSLDTSASGIADGVGKQRTHMEASLLDIWDAIEWVRWILRIVEYLQHTSDGKMKYENTATTCLAKGRTADFSTKTGCPAHEQYFHDKMNFRFFRCTWQNKQFLIFENVRQTGSHQPIVPLLNQFPKLLSPSFSRFFWNFHPWNFRT